MKYKIVCFLFLFFSTITIISFKKSTIYQTQSKTTWGIFEPVAVVELFTSQGCSSCPPADKLLAQTIKNNSNKKIFALSFHVDYWNRLGWIDPFSNAAFSKRQNDYVITLNTNGAYTPQIVVNGVTEFVGSSKTSLNKALHDALQIKSVVDFSSLSAKILDNKQVIISYTLQGKFADCKINAALISKTETTIIKRGENGGSALTNTNVVKQFITEKANGSGEITFTTLPATTLQNHAVIIYIQQNDFKIIGAAMVELK